MKDLKNLKLVIEYVKEALKVETKALEHLFLASEWCSKQLEYESISFKNWCDDKEYLESLKQMRDNEGQLVIPFKDYINTSLVNALDSEIHKLEVFLGHGAELPTEYPIQDTLAITNNYYQIMNHLIEATFYIKFI